MAEPLSRTDGTACRPTAHRLCFVLRLCDLASLCLCAAAREALKSTDDAATYLENTKGADKKWWSISVADKGTRTKWGLIGDDDGSIAEKEHASAAEASKFMQKKIQEKIKGGYVHVRGPPPEGAAAPAADDDSAGGAEGVCRDSCECC